MITHVPLAECKPGTIYRLHSRNLSLGVFDGKHGFIGIREKFGSRYLDTEYHRGDGTSALGTALPYEVLGQLDSAIPLDEVLDNIDARNGRPVAFDRPVADGGRGWYYRDTDEADQTIQATYIANKALFAVLDAIVVSGS